MKHIFFFCLLFLITLNTFSQYGWVEQTSGVTATLTSVSSIYGYSFFSTAWVCGYTGVVLRTTNSGTNWINKSGNGIPNTVSLINILGIDSSTALTAGYIGTTATYVYKSTNGGNNWIQVFTQAAGFINAICRLSNGNLFMQGDPVGGRWSIWKSTNNGTTWDSAGMYLPQIGSETGYNNCMFYNNQRIWFGTNNYKIYYSTNNGTSWITHPVPTEQNIYTIWFGMNQSEGLAAGANMLRTTNFGANWSPVTTLGSGNFGGITSIPIYVDNIIIYENIYYVRSDNKIYFSQQDAQNWLVHHTAPTGTYRYIGRKDPYGPYWAVRTLGGISYHASVGGLKSISSEIPTAFSLKQNYPNPFNHLTTIEFDVPKSSHVVIKIYNSLGEEVTVLVNEKLNAGKFEYKYNAAGLTSGVYFYTLAAYGYSETRKMV